MDRAIFEATMRTFLGRRPYTPFTVSLVNGDQLEVDHPGAVLVRDGLAMYAGPGGVPSVFDYRGVARIIGDLIDNPAEAG